MAGTFWGFHDLIYSLVARGRAPTMLVLENVGGAVTSKDGRDFEKICRALKSLGYLYGALMLDAVHFVPQSRPRVFIVALRAHLDRSVRKLVDDPSPLWMTRALHNSFAQLRADLRQDWRWWLLPPPPARSIGLSDIIIESPADVKWHTESETRYLLSLMSPSNLAKIESAKREGRPTVGTIYRRTRRDSGGTRVQRAEVRFDNVSGCLRTPAGGSSRQTVIIVNGEDTRTRLLSVREAARLMGLPDTYKLPAKYNEAYHLLGDGLAVPVVRHLSRFLLEPMIATSRRSIMAAE